MGVALININDKRVISVDKAIWKAIVYLLEMDKDGFPFTASDVARKIGKEKSSAMITRNRGGLTQMVVRRREMFLSELQTLVDEEANKNGEISLAFCRRLDFLISEHSMLFSIDIAHDSHRNTKLLLEPIRELIHPNKYTIFRSGFYSMLERWYQNEGFNRESVLSEYESKTHELFKQYQIVRPDMSVGGDLKWNE